MVDHEGLVVNVHLTSEWRDCAGFVMELVHKTKYTWPSEWALWSLALELRPSSHIRPLLEVAEQCSLFVASQSVLLHGGEIEMCF